LTLLPLRIVVVGEEGELRSFFPRRSAGGEKASILAAAAVSWVCEQPSIAKKRIGQSHGGARQSTTHRLVPLVAGERARAS